MAQTTTQYSQTGGTDAPLRDRLRAPSTRQLSQERPEIRQNGAGGAGGAGGGGRGQGIGPDVRTRSPLESFDGIHKGSGWNAWSSTAVRHLRMEAAALEEAGLYLFRSIRRTKAWPSQIGKLVAARRITRHLKRAANLQQKAAAEVVAARRAYATAFSAPGKAKPSDFNPDE